MLCGFVVSTVDNIVDEAKVEDETNFVVELVVGKVVVCGKVLDIMVEVV